MEFSQSRWPSPVIPTQMWLITQRWTWWKKKKKKPEICWNLKQLHSFFYGQKHVCGHMSYWNRIKPVDKLVTNLFFLTLQPGKSIVQIINCPSLHLRRRKVCFCRTRSFALLCNGKWETETNSIHTKDNCTQFYIWGFVFLLFFYAKLPSLLHKLKSAPLEQRQ